MNNNQLVYINGRFLCHKTDGISRFALEICKQLKEIGLKFRILVPLWLKYENPHHFDLIKYGNLKSHLWEQVNLLSFLRKNGSPLLVNFSGLGPLFYKNQIITIHDLSFYENKKWFSKAYTFYYGLTTPIVAKRALKIFTVSEFSRNEIVKFLKIKRDKILVIYNAVSENVRFPSQSSSHTTSFKRLFESKYILAVSSIDPRKNLSRLMESFQELNPEGYKLVLVGKASRHFNIKLTSDEDNIIFTGFVADEDLHLLYKKCDFFIYPSLYEGFGIPPLEAMINGCAVIAADIPSLKEVCADAAYYVDPYNIDSIKNAMTTLIHDSELKQELKERGIKRTKEFSWHKSASTVFDTIQKLNF